MEKKTISELYQECKLKQEMEQCKKEMEQRKKEMEQWKKEFLAQLAKDFFGGPVRFSPPIPIATSLPPVFPG